MDRQLKEGVIPKGARTEINQERNANLLLGVVRGGLPDYLLDAREEADTPEGRLRSALPMIEKGTEGEAKIAVIKSLGELRKLDLKLADQESMFDYPLQYLSAAFAKSGARFHKELESSLKRSWQDPFFREMARLWLGRPDALARLEKIEGLTAKTRYPGYGPAQLVYFYLEVRKDPVWKDRCIRDLKNIEMVNARVLSYAKSIMTPDLETVLLERHDKLMASIRKEKAEDENWDWRPGQAMDIEEPWREVQLAMMPLKVVE